MSPAEPVPPSESVVVRDRPDAGRYEIVVGSERAGLVTYRVTGEVIAFLHAEIDRARRRQGLGSRLARGALDDARARGLSVQPLCPFMADFIERHPDEYGDLVA